MVALQGQKGLKNLPKITFEDLSHMLGHNFVKKRERSCHSSVCASMADEAGPLGTHGNKLTTMATPNPVSVENAIDPTCYIAIWFIFLFFPGS